MTQTDPIYSLSFADGPEAAEFLSRLAEAVGGNPDPDVVVWIRAPVIRVGSDQFCCVYATRAAIDAAEAAGLPVDDAEPLSPDEIPVGRIAVIGNEAARPA